MLEIAEAFAGARTRPKRSLFFVWHTAEEKGLDGAQHYAEHPTVPRDSIVAQIAIDRMGRGDPVVDLDHRPVVDEARPDPNAVCRQ